MYFRGPEGVTLRKGLPSPNGLDATSVIVAGIATARDPKPQHSTYTLLIDAREKDDNLVEMFTLTLTTSTTFVGACQHSLLPSKDRAAKPQLSNKRHEYDS